MRTSINIDDELLAAAMRATGLTTKKATVEEGLRRLAQGHRYAKTLALRGKVRWEENLEAMRIDRSDPSASHADRSTAVAAPGPARRRK